MTVLGNDRVDMPRDFLEEIGIRMTDKLTVLREADFVSLHCDLNESSLGLVGDAELTEMSSTSVLINTARGPLVDETALLDALRRGEIAGAGLDVFENEPLPADSPLRSMENVLLSPHNANSSPEAWENVHENSLRNLLAGLDSRDACDHRSASPADI